MNITEKLKQELSPNLLAHIVHLDDFAEPPAFYTMSYEERFKLIEKYRKFEKPPTDSNHWIWFGAFSYRDKLPIFYNQRAIRPIYEALFEPLGKKRLVNALVEHVADVNPFKFIPACGTRYKNSAIVAHQRNFAINSSKLSSISKVREFEERMDKGVEFLKDNLESFPDEDKWGFVLKAFGYLDHEIITVTTRFKEQQHDIISRYQTPTGIPQSPQAFELPTDGRSDDNADIQGPCAPDAEIENSADAEIENSAEIEGNQDLDEDVSGSSGLVLPVGGE